MTNQLYEIPLEVIITEGNTEVPDHIAGAHVMCYAAAADLETALQNGAAKLQDMGWRVADVTGSAREIPAEKWNAYLTSVWPDYLDHFPTAAELPGKIIEGAVFFGIFATYDRP